MIAKRNWRAFVAAGALAIATAAHATAEQARPGDYAEAEVRKVDKDGGRVTLRHGPIANLDMPSMTMVFRVKDPALLEQVKAGDKVRFKAEKVQGAYTVTELGR